MLPSGGSPIVINNACASWHRLSGDFMFGGARSYLGTLFSVFDAEAQEIVARLFGKYFGKELAVAVWRAQNDVYGNSARRPYVLVGCHFQRMRTSDTNALEYVKAELTESLVHWRSYLERGEGTDSVKESVGAMIEFLETELRAVSGGARFRSR